MKRKRITKNYEGGGWTAGSGFSGTNVGKGLGAFGGMAGGLIENADMKDGYMSTGGALGSGALKGVSMGASFGPLGMLVGAGLGAAGGLMKKQQINDAEDARLKAIRDEERLRANMENQMKHQQMNQVLDQFPVKGNNTPRFSMGGPTGGGFDTSRMMVPTYPEGAGPDAMPSFDFYTDGKQVSAQDYIAGLPQGQSINDHSQYWTSTLKPQFDQATQTWSNTGQNPMAQSVYGALQQNAMGGYTKYEGGGDTHPTAKSPEELQAMMQNKALHGEISQWNPSRWDRFKEAMYSHNMADDSNFENAVEMVDPTGVSSWDDAYRASQGPQGIDSSLDYMGALPLVGKFGKGARISNAARPTQVRDGLQYWYGGAKKAANVLNVADGAEDMTGALDGYAMGGDTDPSKADLAATMGNVRAFGLHPMAQEYASKYPSMRDALGEMSQEEFSAFKTKVDALKQDAQGLKGKGIGAAVGFLNNADLGFVKPLREAAGFERGEMVDEILGQTELGWAGRTAAKAAIMTKDFAMGGTTMGPGYEVEGGEMMQTKGETPQTYGQGGMSQVASTEYEVQGPKHSNGGVKANDNQGARVYSDKLTVDSALLNKLSKL